MNILKGLLFDNLGLKLVALLLALAVYFNVFTERPAMMVVAFPIEYSDLPDSLSLSGPTPPAVKAEIRGTGKQFIRLWLTEPRLKISLAGVRPGRFQRAITQDDLPLLASDRIVVERMVGPDSLDLRVEHTAVRRLPVAARVRGVPKPGWVWSGAALADPVTVMVRGPHRAVAQLDSVLLLPVDVGNRQDTVRTHVEASLPPWCTIDPPSVAVAVPLVRH